MEESRIALVGVMVEDADSIEALNRLLHQYGSYIMGRMGLPYRERGVHIISFVIDAPHDVISALSGQLGMLHGVQVKTVCSRR